MISLKFARIFQFERDIDLQELCSVFKANRVAVELGVAQSSYGWCDIVEPSLLHTPAKIPYLIGRFIGKVRTVPKGMVDRELMAEKMRYERAGTPITKDMEKCLAADIYLKLSETIEPEILEGYVIVTSNGEMFVTSKKRPVIDDLVNGLSFMLFEKDYSFKPKVLPLSKHKLKAMATHYNKLGTSLLEVVGKNASETLRIDPYQSADHFYKQTLLNSCIERITLTHNNLLLVTFTHKGAIHDIRFGADFESEWRNYGDGEESHLLDLIRTGLWLDQLKHILDTTSQDAERLCDYMDANASDESLAPKHETVRIYNENVIELFKK